MKYTLLTAAAASALLAASPAFADAETDALKKEVQALEARIDQLEKKEAADKKALVAAKAAKPAPAVVVADDKPEKSVVGSGYVVGASGGNQTLNRRMAIIERKQEIADDAAREQTAAQPKVEVGNGKGFTITSADKQYSMRVAGYVQADNRTFFDRTPGTSTTDQFLIRSARPIIEGKATDYFDTRFMMDFGRGGSTLLDAYGNFHPMPGSNYINFRAGEFKTPLGIERWQGESDVEFVERGQTTNLVPYRDIGVMAYGEIIPKQLEYQIGVVDGVSDLQAATTGDADSDKDIVARLFATPFRWADMPWLHGLGIGVAGSYGIHSGTAANPELTAGYASPGQRTYFNYVSAAGTTFADGPQWRINPQLLYYNGPFGFMGEYVKNSQEVGKNNVPNTAKLQNDAWLGSASYVLTGEDAAYDGVKPAHPFDPKSGNWGAFELVGRMSKLDVDSKAFPIFANPATSSRSAFEHIAGGTWYFNNSIKFNLDFAYTTFNGGALGGVDHKSEEALLARTQLKF